MLSDGLPYPLGATPGADGINFALAAPHAEAVDLCLFDAAGHGEQQRLRLHACTDGVWHGRLPGAQPGLVYGWRVHGPWAPQAGHRFNAAKVLLDPYAREVVGRYTGDAIFNGHAADDPARPDRRDNAAVALKARVVAAGLLPPVSHPRIAPADRVIYELHVRGFTRLHPGVPEALRGSYAALAEPVVLDHLQRLGVTTLSLMPVQHRADEARLLQLGLSNYWGYNTIGWFAPERRYWSARPGTTPESEFRAMVDAVHARGMEVVIDVVYNHSAESDALGPTLSLRGIDNALYYRLCADDQARYENWTGCGNCLDFRQPRVVQLVMDSLRHWVQVLGVDGFRFDLAPVLGRTGPPDSIGFDARAPLFTALLQDPVLSRALLIAEPWDLGPEGYALGRFPPGWLEWNDRYRDTQRAFWLHAARTRGDFAHRLTASSGEFRHRARAATSSVNFVTAHDGFTLRDLVSYAERHNHANGEHNRDGHGHNLSRNFGVEGPSDDATVQGRRQAAQRVLLAVLMLSQGTPMLWAGDEIGHSQRGNNNAYCQDNATSWIDWGAGDAALTRFVERLGALRRHAMALRQAAWWPHDPALAHAAPQWLTPGGLPMTPAEWERTDAHALAVEFPAPPPQPRWLLLVNAAPRELRFDLPPGPWQLELASDAPDASARALQSNEVLPGMSLWLAQSLRGSSATLTHLTGTQKATRMNTPVSTPPLQAHQLVRRTIALVLAGGRGSRLKQLTDRRAKPAVYFGGKFRIIDFALSNCLNSGIRRMAVVTQYKSHSLMRHLQRGWSFLRAELNEMVDVLPAQQRMGDESWYRGTADAVFQNLDIIQTRSTPHDYVVVLAGDHIYKMDYSIMVMDHALHGRGCTVGCIEVPRAEATAFGVMHVDDARRITDFLEKPADPPPMPGRPDMALASMGIYVFDSEYLYQLLEEDSRDPGSEHDFGKDIIPRVVAQGRAVAHPFGLSCVTRGPRSANAPAYWRDVGTIDAFWAANLDLASVTPELDIYDTDWPIWTYQRQLPPAKFVLDRDGQNGSAVNTIVSGGCIVSGSQVRDSVLFSGVRIHSFCEIREAVLLPDVEVGRGARLRKVVIDRACAIPPGMVIGEDAAADAQRFERTEQGVVLVTREMLARLAAA